MELRGRHVHLVPLTPEHGADLVAAASIEPQLYRWTRVPQNEEQAARYIAEALQWQADGTSIPFAIVRASDGEVIGSTRIFNIEHWPWPESHPRHGRKDPDATEIGYTWLSANAVRTPANSEAKLLLMAHAFEDWGVFRVCFHTDERNQRSRAALKRIGARFEGILMSHRLAADFIPRNSARFSVTADEWPAIKSSLEQKR